MKSTISTIALATIVAIASLSQAHAQTQASRVSVPFAFECGGTSFAPGTYIFSKTDGDHLSLRTNQNMSIVLASVGHVLSAPARGYVTFNKYGNRYFLAEYHPSNSGTEIDLPRSKKERIVARDYAMNSAEPGRVQLALNDSDWLR